MSHWNPPVVCNITSLVNGDLVSIVFSSWKVEMFEDKINLNERHFQTWHNSEYFIDHYEYVLKFNMDWDYCYVRSKMPIGG
jgi:hypothetical protein